MTTLPSHLNPSSRLSICAITTTTKQIDIATIIAVSEDNLFYELDSVRTSALFDSPLEPVMIISGEVSQDVYNTWILEREALELHERLSTSVDFILDNPIEAIYIES